MQGHGLIWKFFNTCHTKSLFLAVKLETMLQEVGSLFGKSYTEVLFFHPVSLREANGLIEKPLNFIFRAFETVFQMSLTH